MSFMSGRLNVFSVSSATCRLTCSDDIFLPNVGPTFSTCLRHVGVCRDDMSFYGSWRRDVTPTFPTKQGTCGKENGFHHTCNVNWLESNGKDAELRKLCYICVQKI